MILLIVALLSQASNALVISGQGTMVASSATHHTAANPILVRPNAGKGPEKVLFGLRAKNFYGSNLKRFRFSLDLVMTIRWTDPRVVALLPEGVDKFSMAWKDAEKKMWMPGIVVSNRDIEQYEIVSASVTIYRSGEVRRVERANARVMKKFELQDYPFDTQDLAVNVASSKYMLDEVVLSPDPDTKSSGVDEDIWGLYDFVSWKTETREQSDGDLVKSRGVLSVRVRRSLDKYSQDHLMPSFIVLMISWAVFYFPFANPFITARLALSILALLQFTNLIIKSTKELPGAAPYNWNDLFNQQIQTLMFVTILLNIVSEICFHSFQNEKLARGLNNEAKLLMPMLSIINISLIGGGCKYHWMSLAHTIIVTKVVLFVLLALYISYAFYEQFARWREAKEEEEEAQEVCDKLGMK